MIRFNLRKIVRLDIARPTLLEIIGLAMVLCFVAVIVLLSR
jgi:hypothetical protein